MEESPGALLDDVLSKPHLSNPYSIMLSQTGTGFLVLYALMALVGPTTFYTRFECCDHSCFMLGGTAH